VTDTRGVRGLYEATAARRLAADGPNTVATTPPPRLAYRILRQLTDPLVALLLASAVVTTLLRDATDTAVIVLVVIVNTAIGVSQEIRAERAISALQRLGAPIARVVRDGTDRVVPAADLVRDDLVVLAAGDVVPADLVLTEAQRLRLDESMLTGESVAVSRGTGDEVYAGTVVLTGRAEGVVARTGATSALGRIASLVASTRPGPTPLQRRLTRLGRILGLVVVLLSALVMVLGLLAGRPPAQMAITAVSLVVAAVPESMPAVVTLALALGAYRMARGNAIARRLHAVETLGSVTVLASDKTGTITEGRMSVERAVTADGCSLRVPGRGYEPTPLVDEPPGPLVDLARAAVLCNDAHLVPPSPESPDWTGAGDPLEVALLAFAARCGLDPDAERAAAPRVGEHPFDAATRRMVTWHTLPDGRTLVVCKGAPEVVLDASAPHLLRAAHELADAGLRVLAIATAVRPAEADAVVRPAEADAVVRPTIAAVPAVAAGTAVAAGDSVAGLRPLGLVGIGDPIREGAPDVATAFETAGIRLVLVTGDHPATATSIAGRLGIFRAGDTVVRGDEGPPDGDGKARVYARILPEQKLDIIAALQRAGHVVAMTGDGVNDAPALRRADIGVAMGGSGTEVARQAADLVLTDDNLATVALAVGEGRRIYDNIRRFLRYALSGGAAELLIMLIGPFLGLAVPLLPAQILWVNLLTHGLPGVALGAEPASPGVMARPPRSPQESVLGAGLAGSVLIGGSVIAACVLGAALGAYRLGAPWQSVGFVVLGLAQLGVALAVRAPRQPGGSRNPGLAAAVALSAVLQVAAVTWEPLRVLLGTESLTPAQLAACAGVAAVPGGALAVVRALARRRGRRSPRIGTSGPAAAPEAKTTLEATEEVGS
jgi:P-type Ca2+ transporter type 2C